MKPTPERSRFVRFSGAWGSDPSCAVRPLTGVFSVSSLRHARQHSNRGQDFTSDAAPDCTLGVDAAAQELSLMQLAAVWHSCFALQGQFASRRARMEEDPNKIPEMAQEDHAEFRPGFVTAHPGTLQEVRREAQQRFSGPWHGAVLHRGGDPHLR